MTFHYTDEDGDPIDVRPAIGVPFVVINTGPNGCFIPLDKVEELIAGIRDTARQPAGRESDRRRLAHCHAPRQPVRRLPAHPQLAHELRGLHRRPLRLWPLPAARRGAADRGSGAAAGDAVMTQPDLRKELAPLANVIAETLRTTPVRHGPGGTDDLIANLTLATAAYVGRAVLPLAPPPLSSATDRLARIAQAHSKEVGPGGMTSGDCDECGHPWPCPTNVWATQERDPLATWDPADDEQP